MQTYVNLKQLLEEMIDHQKKKLLNFGRKIVPYLTSDDILQPNDYPELEHHPIFRYEEGVLEGLQSALMALQRQEKEES